MFFHGMRSLLVNGHSPLSTLYSSQSANYEFFYYNAQEIVEIQIVTASFQQPPKSTKSTKQQPNTTTNTTNKQQATILHWC